MTTKKPGTIALDVDGTLTAAIHNHKLPKEVSSYLSSLVKEGWQVLFITGRTFSAVHGILEVLDFPCFLAVQNGAIVLKLPEKRVVAKKYLSLEILSAMEEICCNEESDFVIYGGFEQQDRCYYRPSRFSSPLLHYLKKRQLAFNELWEPLDSFAELDFPAFPSLKCFGFYEDAKRLEQKIFQRLGLYVPLIRDPYDEGYYIVQATHAEINKGQALQDLLQILGGGEHRNRCDRGIVIAAGDDRNDIPMLEKADIKIGMATAPQDILDMVDIVAPPASEAGIIVGLKRAIHGG